MLYCPLCRRVFEENEEKCPYCENAEIRKAENGDKVFLLTADPEAASLLCESFNNAEIEYETAEINRVGDSPFSGKAFIPDSAFYIYFKDFDAANYITSAAFEEIKASNAPPDAKNIISQTVSVIIFILAVTLAVFAADLIAGLFK